MSADELKALLAACPPGTIVGVQQPGGGWAPGTAPTTIIGVNRMVASDGVHLIAYHFDGSATTVTL